MHDIYQRFCKIRGHHLFQLTHDMEMLAKRTGPTYFIKRMEKAIGTLVNYAKTWKIQLNHSKAEIILTGRKRPKGDVLEIRRKHVRLKTFATYLGIIIDHRLNYGVHTKQLMELVFRRYGQLFRLLSHRLRLRISKTVLLPSTRHGQEVWCRKVQSTNPEDLIDTLVYPERRHHTSQPY